MAAATLTSTQNGGRNALSFPTQPHPRPLRAPQQPCRCYKCYQMLPQSDRFHRPAPLRTPRCNVCNVLQYFFDCKAFPASIQRCDNSSPPTAKTKPPQPQETPLVLQKRRSWLRRHDFFNQTKPPPPIPSSSTAASTAPTPRMATMRLCCIRLGSGQVESSQPRLLPPFPKLQCHPSDKSEWSRRFWLKTTPGAITKESPYGPGRG